MWQFTTWHYKQGTENVKKFVSKFPVQWKFISPEKKEEKYKCSQFIHSISRRYFEQPVKISSALMHWLHFCYQLKVYGGAVYLFSLE
jgi:protein involved in ribonucleotide reduction